MSNLRFLVVDDAIFMRTVLKKMLSEEGFEVVGEAGNGLDAIQMAAELQPDIITLDITMPVMDGIKAVPGILKVSPNSKIIMCSALGQQAMVVDAIKKGAKDFIVKPFEKSRVLQAINNVMSR
ncbi:response regulator [Defluviitalea raffinosedens]|uniref:response regulator n=1 Tax=Defluviitalea raffinosedens TaxID=1450156 RepID=UPI00175BA7BB|nr:response regulator [Defluviitalea raffinosedens]MBM7685574.1 two-component system chemotaxis response regulator CheY [Defluviitalea raffinosedens]HHW66697.1 response regulator [Candidatus Epulonipiscium sp.]